MVATGVAPQQCQKPDIARESSKEGERVQSADGDIGKFKVGAGSYPPNP